MLESLANDYKKQENNTIKIENERSRLQDILTKLKGTLTDSQNNDFNIVFREVISIFDRSRMNKC